MGSKLVTPQQESSGRGKNSAISYSDLLDKCLPTYLFYGMTPEQYWDGGSQLTIAYRKAYEMKMKERNYELWLQGKYIYDALGSIAPVMNAFAKQGTRATPYLKEPYPITPEDIREQKEREAKAKFDKALAKVSSWANKVNKGF